MTTTPKKSTSNPSKGESKGEKPSKTFNSESEDESQKKLSQEEASGRGAAPKPQKTGLTLPSSAEDKKHPKLNSRPHSKEDGQAPSALRARPSPRESDKKLPRSPRLNPRDQERSFEGSPRRRSSEVPVKGDGNRRLPKDEKAPKSFKKTSQTGTKEGAPKPGPSALERFRSGNRAAHSSKTESSFVKKTGPRDESRVEGLREEGRPRRNSPRVSRELDSKRDSVQAPAKRAPLRAGERAAHSLQKPIKKSPQKPSTPLKTRQTPRQMIPEERVPEGSPDPSQGIRIQKWLSIQGIASRREAEGWIEEGKVFVNGKLVTEQGMRIDPHTDKVTVLGRHINNTPPPRVYWLLHKPDMVLTSRPDGTGRMSIYDLHSTKDLQFLVSPVGRLDYRTEGLLLLSNDGELVHRLAHPKYKVPRYYNVLIDGRLSYEEESALRRGIELEDGVTGKSEVIFAHSVNLGQSRGSWYFITVFEGRNRLVRRMFEHFGFKVVRLVRYGFGDLRLPDDLPAGEYRQLTPSEIKYLKDTVNLSGDV